MYVDEPSDPNAPQVSCRQSMIDYRHACWYLLGLNCFT